MSKNKVIKIISILFIVAVLVLSFTSASFAMGTDIQNGLDTNKVEGKLDQSGAGVSIANMIGIIISVAQVIAIGVAVIMLAVLAIKYMSSAPNDKAEIKKHAVVYVVGAIVLFGATGILQVIKQFAGGINDTANSIGE